jgi:hypothetical protein
LKQYSLGPQGNSIAGIIGGGSAASFSAYFSALERPGAVVGWTSARSSRRSRVAVSVAPS